jgi:hypothetical protein
VFSSSDKDSERTGFGTNVIDTVGFLTHTAGTTVAVAAED